MVQERDAETAAKVLAANAKIAKLAMQLEELAEEKTKVKKMLAGLKQNEVYRDAGMRYLTDLKFQIRSLSVQCGESKTEADDSFLCRQLSFCGPEPAEVDYLRGLIRKLKAKRSGMFLLGSISPDPVEDSQGKADYKLGKSIGKPSTIPVH